MRRLVFLAVAALVLFASGCGSETPPLAAEATPEATPSAWTELGIDAASALAMAEGKTVLVYAYTTWCGWCRRMDQETWPQAELGLWMSEHMVAYAWNVEDTEQGNMHHIFQVTAIPTVILSRGLEEFARHEGYLPPEALQAWLQAAIQPMEAE